MNTPYLQLHSHARLQQDGGDWLIAKTDGKAVRYRAAGAAVSALLRRLADTGGYRDALIADTQTAEPNADLATLYYVLTILEQRGLLAFSLRQDGRTLATLEPMTGPFRRVTPDPHAVGYRLSRFAWLHRSDDNMLLECALGQCRLHLADPRCAAVVAALTTPQTPASLARQSPDLSADHLLALLALLTDARAIFPCDAEGRLPEDADPVLRHWDYHDLLFHTRSRMGRHDFPFGGTFHLAGSLPHAPARKSAGQGTRFPLPEPQADASGARFFEVLERRRSLRQYSDTPLSVNQLGHLLWHVARVQSHRPADPDNPRQYAVTLRPVAGGGAMHELELYLTVNRCTGLKAGLYRFDPFTHELAWLREPNADTQGLLQDAVQAAGLERAPDVLITLAARFARMSWKYQGMAYAATLKHVGVIYQQLYLVATALDLAPCALGAGNADRFAAAANTDYYEETSVGEFALSSKPTVIQETP